MFIHNYKRLGGASGIAYWSKLSEGAVRYHHSYARFHLRVGDYAVMIYRDCR